MLSSSASWSPSWPSRKAVIIGAIAFLGILVFLELRFPFLRSNAKHWNGEVVCSHTPISAQALIETARSSQQKVLVIGSSNLLGRALAEYLGSTLKLKVTGVDEVETDVPSEHFEQRIGSLRDRAFLAKVLSGSHDMIFHVTSVNGTSFDVAPLVSLVSLAAAAGIQTFVFLSSTEVSAVEVTGDRVVVPGRHVAGLVASEVVVRSSTAMNTLIVRVPLHGIYGPGLRWVRSSIMDTVLDDLMHGREVSVGPQNYQMPFTYVGDLVPAIALAPFSPVETHLLHLGLDTLYPVRNMARDLYKALDQAQLKMGGPFSAHFSGDSHVHTPTEIGLNLHALLRRTRCYLGEVAAMPTDTDAGLQKYVAWLRSGHAQLPEIYESIVRGTGVPVPAPGVLHNPPAGALSPETPEVIVKCAKEDAPAPAPALPAPAPKKESEIHIATIATANLIFHAYAMTNALMAHCPRCHVHIIFLDMPELQFQLFHARVKVYYAKIDQRIFDMGPKGAGGDGTFMKWWVPEITGLTKYWWVDIDNFAMPNVMTLFETYDHEECILQEELGMTHGALFHCYMGMNALDLFYKYQSEARAYVSSKGWGLSDQPLMDFFARTGKINATIKAMGIHNCFSSKDRPFYFIHVSGNKAQTPDIFANCARELRP